jgi:hypothetical protein
LTSAARLSSGNLFSWHSSAFWTHNLFLRSHYATLGFRCLPKFRNKTICAGGLQGWISVMIWRIYLSRVRFDCPNLQDILTLLKHTVAVRRRWARQYGRVGLIEKSSSSVSVSFSATSLWRTGTSLISLSAVPCRALRSTATKCVSKNHGYSTTLHGVDQSLARFGFGGHVAWTI